MKTVSSSIYSRLLNYVSVFFKKNSFLVIISLLFCQHVSVQATHYSNKTTRTITITNVSAEKRQGVTKPKPRYWWSTSWWSLNNKQAEPEIIPYAIVLEKDQEGDLENDQDDEITITSEGMSDKRKLFPTNNSFNYVITMNNYNAKFEQFDINRAD